MAEMDNSLQLQLYDQQMQMQNDALMQQQNSYNMFQQQMQSRQMMQMQQLQPINMVANRAPMMASNFVNGQMQGVYSGLGINPGVQNAFSNMVGTPLMNGAQSTMSLAGGYANMLAYGSGGMSFQQQSDLQRTIATNTAQLAVGAGSAIGSVANFAGSLYGMSFLGGGAAGIAAGFGLPLAYGAAKWALTNPMISALSGGQFGGYNPNVFNPLAQFSQELSENKQYGDILSQSAYTFMAPGAGQSMYGQGLSLSQTQQYSAALRNLGPQLKTSDQDISSIFQGSVSNGLLTDVTGLGDFGDQFSSLVNYVKEASKMLNKNVQEITSMMGELKQAGIQQSNYTLDLAQIQTVSNMIGQTVDTTKQWMLNQTQNVTQGTMNSPQTAYVAAGTTASMVGLMYNQAKQNGDQDTMNLINNNGGITGSASASQSAMTALFSNPGVSILFGGFASAGANGKININAGAIAAAAQNGTTTAQLMTNASSVLGNNPSLDMNYQSQAGSVLSGQSFSTQNQLLQLILNSAKSSGQDPSTILHMYGLSADQTSLLLAENSNYSTLGVQAQAANILNPLFQQSASIMEIAKEQQLSGHLFSSTATLNKIADAVAVGPANSLQTWEQNYTNQLAGLPNEDIYNHQISSYNYDFLHDNGGATTTANLKDMYTAASLPIPQAPGPDPNAWNLGTQTQNSAYLSTLDPGLRTSTADQLLASKQINAVTAEQIKTGQGGAWSDPTVISKVQNQIQTKAWAVGPKGNAQTLTSAGTTQEVLAKSTNLMAAFTSLNNEQQKTITGLGFNAGVTGQLIAMAQQGSSSADVYHWLNSQNIGATPTQLNALNAYYGAAKPGVNSQASIYTEQEVNRNSYNNSAVALQGLTQNQQTQTAQGKDVLSIGQKAIGLLMAGTLPAGWDANDTKDKATSHAMSYAMTYLAQLGTKANVSGTTAAAAVTGSFQDIFRNASNEMTPGVATKYFTDNLIGAATDTSEGGLLTQMAAALPAGSTDSATAQKLIKQVTNIANSGSLLNNNASSVFAQAYQFLEKQQAGSSATSSQPGANGSVSGAIGDDANATQQLLSYFSQRFDQITDYINSNGGHVAPISFTPTTSSTPGPSPSNTPQVGWLQNNWNFIKDGFKG